VRDKETGKSRGFAFLKYEDQRSTDLAVDNLGGAVIMGRTLRVDHTRYKKKDDEPEEGEDLNAAQREFEDVDGESMRKLRRTSESESEEERPMLKEERELAKLIQEHDEEDPMKAYLIQEKKEEVALALARVKESKHSEKSRKHRHHHHRSHRSREDSEGEDSRRSHRRREGHSRHRSHSRDDLRDSDPYREDERTRRRISGREKSEEYRSRRRSPRRDGHGRDDDERRRRREESPGDTRHRERRDSRH